MLSKSFRCNMVLLIIRIMLGTTFIMHGGAKMLQFFKADGLSSLVQLVGSTGIPPWFAYFVPFFEFFGGIMVLLGIATEVGALLILCVMVGATFLIHFKAGYFGPQGFEYPFNLLLASIALIIGGPGSWTLPSFIRRTR